MPSSRPRELYAFVFGAAAGRGPAGRRVTMAFAGFFALPHAAHAARPVPGAVPQPVPSQRRTTLIFLPLRGWISTNLGNPPGVV